MAKYQMARFRGVAHLVSEAGGAKDPAICGARPLGVLHRGWDFDDKKAEHRICVVCQWAEFEEGRKTMSARSVFVNESELQLARQVARPVIENHRGIDAAYLDDGAAAANIISDNARIEAAELFAQPGYLINIVRDLDVHGEQTLAREIVETVGNALLQRRARVQST